jgi:protein-S-isoprenylcysteine O-methyltransferase Ste14
VTRFAHRGGWWVVAQLALMLAAIVAGPWLGEHASGTMRWIANALLACGVALAIWSRVALGRSFTAFPRPVDGGSQVASGPYRFVRHPMYAAVILCLASWALMFQSLAVAGLAAATLVLLDMKARREERWLAEAYPGYADYRRSTRKLIPFVY